MSNNKILLSLVLLTLFLSSTNFALMLGLNSHNHLNPSSQYSIIKSACANTFYPDLCFSAIATSKHGLVQKVRSLRDVIEASLSITTNAVHKNNLTISGLLNTKGLSGRGNFALHDCLETIDETLGELQNAIADLKMYPSKKSLYQHSNDLKTMVSSVLTNQQTCMDGFHQDEVPADKRVLAALRGGQVHVEQMCSNALAMIKKMIDTDIANFEKKMGINGRRLMEAKEEGIRWPEWISAKDRRLLQAQSVKPDVVVAADGSGTFRTVSEAVSAAPKKSTRRYVIMIKSGVYNENVEVPREKTNIMLMGEGNNRTIITGSRNFVDGSTTFHSATVAVVGERFLARDITFQNTAGPSKHQAVALRVNADLSAFFRCNIIAYQDTLYLHSNRQFFINCLIIGTVDFIFGNSAAVLQDCNIQARCPDSGQKNMITAQGRLDPNQNTGIVIHKCRIGATQDLEPVKGKFPTFLGRPWKQYSRTVILKSSISDVIQPEGWHPWNESDFALKTLYYAEYQNSGPGAETSGRVKWSGFRIITTDTEAQAFTPENFIAGASWLGSTGFPHFLGL